MLLLPPQPPVLPVPAPGVLTPVRIATIGDSHSTVEAGFGVFMATKAGIPVEHRSVGVNGASVLSLLKSLEGRNNAYSVAALKRWRPDVILLAFGTNEAKNWRSLNPGEYSMAWERLLDLISLEFQGVKVIIVGPPDGPFQGLGPVRRIQSDVATHRGLLWVDRVSLMGGDGALAQWRGACGGRYASKDGVHLTSLGYSELARRVVRHIPRSYLVWRLQP